MRKLFLLLVVSCLGGVAVFAQAGKVSYSIGVVVSTPVYLKVTETSKATGIGLDIKREQRFGKHFAWTVGAGFNYFTGDYTYLDYLTSEHFSMLKHSANIPVLGGVKYYFYRGFYASGEAGLLIGADKNTGTHLALVPSAGYQFAGKHPVDAGLKLVNVMQGYGLLESNSLRNGGYGFLSLRVAVGL